LSEEFSLSNLLDTLNPQQREAVVESEGRVLVLAGAGSGKTKVLMSRIAYLIAAKSIEPSQILGLTFTNKAAEEMRERLSKLIGSSAAKKVTLCTFHSFCLKMLREFAPYLGYTRRFSLYHEQDVRRLMQQIIRDELSHEGELPSLAPTWTRLDMARQLGIEPIEMECQEEIWHHHFCQKVYIRLKQALRAYNAMDFNSLIELSVELLEEHPTVSTLIKHRYRYVMIDEYQDTNPIQDRLAKLLASHNNLCVVGDDDQSIYGWRGGQVRNILDFEAGAKIKLEQNYRSTNLILQAANHVIAHNKERYAKTLWSQKGEGKPLEVFHAPNETQEAEAVIGRLMRLKEREGLKWKDFAILYRSNALARTFESLLVRYSWQDGAHGVWRKGVPYEVFGGESFYECREVRDIVAYIRLILNHQDNEAFLRVINQPRRGIGEATLDQLTKIQRQQGGVLYHYLAKAREDNHYSVSIRTSMSNFLILIENSMKMFSENSLSSSIEYLVEAINYNKAIDEEVKSEVMRDLKKKNIKQLIDSARDFETNERNLSGLDLAADFISCSQLDPANWAARKDRKADAIHLMTFHSAKGLEFPAVFLVGLEDHILPHERSVEQTGVEEERRLFYVAITRAQKDLTMSMATTRERFGKTQASKPSRFLFDIPSRLLKITKWNDY
jgi:DNA helicase-2/ATP-dependent DNA helicase PcrA